MEKKSVKIAKKVEKAVKRKHVGLRTKVQFLLLGRMQMGEAAWNPTDSIWWENHGWLNGKRPW